MHFAAFQIIAMRIQSFIRHFLFGTSLYSLETIFPATDCLLKYGTETSTEYSMQFPKHKTHLISHHTVCLFAQDTLGVMKTITMGIMFRILLYQYGELTPIIFTTMLAIAMILGRACCNEILLDTSASYLKFCISTT